MKYLLPEELGGGEVNEATNYGLPVPQGWILVAYAGKLHIIHRDHLRPVPPPTPEEPPPGAYQIGDDIVQRIDVESAMHWTLIVDGGTRWETWDGLWQLLGGPDVTIQRLVPEPAKVELPWNYATWTIRDDVDGEVSISVGSRHYGLAHAGAREMAAALLTAAGEP